MGEESDNGPYKILSETLSDGTIIMEYSITAKNILKSGDPIRYILCTFHQTHIGDDVIVKSLLMAVASQGVINTHGLHLEITGGSGKGKSHAVNTFLDLIPQRNRVQGTFSDKALFYDDDIEEETVLVFDDTMMSEALQSTFKDAATNFDREIIHRTVHDHKADKKKIPPRCVWVILKKEGTGDDQVLNRVLFPWVDESSEQDKLVLKSIQASEAGQFPTNDNKKFIEGRVEVCREIFEELKNYRIYVNIPFAKDIVFARYDNRREPNILFDLIKGFAYFRSRQRNMDIGDDGVHSISATKQDFDDALALYTELNSERGGQLTKLTRKETDVLHTIEQLSAGVDQDFSIQEIMSACGYDYDSIYHTLEGYWKGDRKYDGLLKKCPALSVSEHSVSQRDDEGVTRGRRIKTYRLNLQRYKSWISNRMWISLKTNHSDDRRPSDNQTTNSVVVPNSISIGEKHEESPSLYYDSIISMTKNSESKENNHIHSDSHIPENVIGSGENSPSNGLMNSNLQTNKKMERCTVSPDSITNHQLSSGKNLPLKTNDTFHYVTVNLGKCDTCQKAPAHYQSDQNPSYKVCQNCMMVGISKNYD